MIEIQPEDKVTVVFADDHAVVRKGLLAFFETAPDIVILGVAERGTEAVSVVEKFKPQVVLLDLLMPDQTAAQTIEHIKKVSPLSQVVVLTSHEGDEYVSDVLKAGALSYILKDIDPEELIVAVRKAAIGERVLSARLEQYLLNNLKNNPCEALNSLTMREDEVLRLIAKGLTNGEIAEKLFISEFTVKSHVSNILGKLYLTDRTKLAVYAWEKGLINKGR